MQERTLHIITHDVPWPADFGGVFDLFYKIKSLHSAGVKIHLHCFLNKRPPQEELEKYCASVTYYPRQKKVTNFSFRLPFIVNSRKSDALVNNLKKDNHPILVEGIHCSHCIYTGAFENRIILLRLHNTEFEYYHHLALHEKNPLRRFYFNHESRLLKKYEQQIASKISIAAVSNHDVQFYRSLGATDVFHLPVFLPYTIASGRDGQGTYCLYHGNLSINENEEAAIWLLKEVFNDIDIPFVVAGKDPSEKLTYLVKQHQCACLVANPSDKELHDMIAKAQVNVLPSFNNTGVKLKLLNALYNGRHCLLNKAGVDGSGLDKLCTIADDIAGFKNALKLLYKLPYTQWDNEQREFVLQKIYNNETNVKKLIEIFWSAKQPQ